MPAEAFHRLTQTYESAGQCGKWSSYFRAPWLEIWRPNSEGWFCYAVRFERNSKGGFAAAESWIGEEIRSEGRGLGSDLPMHREILTSLLSGLSGYDPSAFTNEIISGRIGRESVSFSGAVRNMSDVEQLTALLREQLVRMERARA